MSVKLRGCLTCVADRDALKLAEANFEIEVSCKDNPLYPPNRTLTDASPMNPGTLPIITAPGSVAISCGAGLAWITHLERNGEGHNVHLTIPSDLRDLCGKQFFLLCWSGSVQTQRVLRLLHTHQKTTSFC